MSFKLGNTNIGELYVGSNKIAQAYLGSNLVYQAAAPGPVLPANTVRVRTSDGNAPNKGAYTSYETATLVPGTSDVYDVYKGGTTFGNFLYGSNNVIEVLEANITGVTSTETMFASCTALQSAALFDTSNVTRMNNMFSNDTSLQSVPLFDTSNVTSMYGMFNSCNSLTSVPLFDTSNVTSMYRMFYKCTNVQSGALALYQQASSQANPPSNHNGTFYQCGKNTQTGAAELAQIPSDWK